MFTIIPSIAIWAFFYGGIGFSKAKLPYYFLCAFGLGFILVEYLLIYIIKKPATGLVQEQNTSVSIAPFVVWKFYSSSVAIALLTSFFFPLLFFIVTKGRILKDGLVKFATINWVIGLLIFILFIENGKAKYDGNFGWQAIICNYLLFFTLSIKLLLLSSEKKMSRPKSIVLYAALLLHIFWGLVYFLKIIVLKNYI